MKFICLTAFVLGFFLFSGCAFTPPIPTKDANPSSALVVIRSVASGKYFAGLGFSIFGDESFGFILKNKQSGEEFECLRFNSKICIVGNIPAGDYEISRAITPLKKPIVGTRIEAGLGKYTFDISVKPDVNYLGNYIITTEQDGFSLNVAIWKEVPFTAEDQSLINQLLQNSPDAGWKMAE